MKTVMVDKDVEMDHVTYETRDKVVQDTVFRPVTRNVQQTRLQTSTVMTPHTTTESRVTMERGWTTTPKVVYNDHTTS